MEITEATLEELTLCVLKERISPKGMKAMLCALCGQFLTLPSEGSN